MPHPVIQEESMSNKIRTKLGHVKMEVGAKFEPIVAAVAQAESAIQRLQEGFSCAEVVAMMQILQATSYNGVFVWKIQEVQRQKQEASISTRQVISLYSAPSRHGYKVCLRLHLNGDGSGLSFILTIMRGEHDAFLHYPFRQRVTLMLLDQDGSSHVVMSFLPDFPSPSFQRRSSEMNIASACPMLLPLHTRYVKDDTIFVKCKTAVHAD